MSASRREGACLPSNCELRIPNFYIAVILEGLGVALLVFVGGTMFIQFDVKKKEYVLEIAVVYGVTIAALSQVLMDISDSHLNPAITIACLITRRISFLRGFCYVIFQCGGGIVGTILLRFLVPSSKEGDYAMTRLSSDLTIVGGMVFEMLFTLIYSMLYFSLTSPKSDSAFKEVNGPLLIGLFYGVSHIVLIERTGCSLNPARSIGPAVVKNDFHHIWIYVAGPILASCFGVLMYDLVLKKSPKRLHPRPRSISLLCCKSSRQEIISRQNQAGYDEEYIVRKQEARV